MSFNFDDVLVNAPIAASAAARSPIEKARDLVEFFIETGDPQSIEGAAGKVVTIGNNFNAGSANVILGKKIVCTSRCTETLAQAIAVYL